MRKTSAYIFSLLFLFISGLAILHPSYQAISSWLSPVTGGFVYTVFIMFSLLIADPFKYIAVGMVWILTGLIIGLISQKKLGASIVAFFTWLSMIPTLGVAAFGIYTNLEAHGVFTIDSVDEILMAIPNVPAQLNFNSLFEIPIISELVFELMEIIPNLGENSDPMQVMIAVAMPYATAFILKPLLIIVSAIIGAVVGKRVFSKIDIDLLSNRKVAASIVIALIVTQAAYLPTTRGQVPELDEQTLEFLAALGIDVEDLDIETLAEIGLSIEDLEAIAAIDPEDIDLDTLTEMGIDTEIAIMMVISGGMNTTEGTGPGLGISIDTDDGIYLELMGGFVENQGRAVTGEVLLGSDIETVSSTASHVQELAASVILTQKIFNPSVLYTLPVEGIEGYVQFVGIAPEIVAVNLYVGEDVDAVTAKSDQLIDDYEDMYGVQFERITAMQQTFGQDEGATIEIPPFVVCVYYSLDTVDDLITNMLTGFESKGGVASSFQEIVEGERNDIELYVIGQVTPSYLQAFMSLPEEMAMFQDLIDALFAETFHFVVGVQLIDEAVDPGSGAFDLTDALGISSPRFSSDADIGVMALARPNSTDPEPSIKLATNIDQASTEFMFLYMYLNTIMPMDISGGMVPDRNDLRISVPDYSAPDITVDKSSQTSGGVETVTVTITNDGPSAVTDMELNDVFPDKYDVLNSGSSTATWTRLSPGESVSLSYEIKYENPGTYTNMPAVLSYEEDGETRIAVSNILPALSKSPSGLTLLSENYQATFDVIDMVTGNGDLFGMIPLAFIALITAIDAFKIYRQRSTSEPPAPEEPQLPESPSDEDTPGDPL